MYLLLSTSPLFGLQVVGYSDTYVDSPNYVPMGDVPFPSQLVGIDQNWIQASDRGHATFFALNPSSYVPSPIPMTSWTRVLDLLGEDNGIQWTYGSESFPWATDVYSDIIFTNVFGALEVPYEYTWQQAEHRAKVLQVEMTPDLNNYLITGTPLDPVFGAINSVLNNLQINYTTPTEAVVAMRGGLSGLALLLGYSWPPPDPA